MVFTHTDEAKRLCREWLKDPLVNPKTGMPIARNGPTYKKMIAECKRLGMPTKPAKNTEKKLSARMCGIWRKTPHLNPETGREIQVGGSMYKKIERMCKGVYEKQPVLEGKYYVPDKKGYVPAIKTRGSYYIIRKVDDHVVYSPLNTLISKSKSVLVYYQDTWDYHQGYYRPIFEGGAPPRPRGCSHASANPKNRPKPAQDPKYKVDKLLGFFM